LFAYAAKMMLLLSMANWLICCLTTISGFRCWEEYLQKNSNVYAFAEEITVNSGEVAALKNALQYQESICRDFDS